MTDIQALPDGLLTPPEDWSPHEGDPLPFKRAEDMEVYLPDERVWPIQERVVEKYSIFLDWDTDFLTVLHKPPFTGPLPDGTSGTTMNEVVQFLLVSDYPATRKIQREHGIRHGTVAAAWRRAWEEAEHEYRSGGHFVGQVNEDPLLAIFASLAAQHYDEMMQLASITN